MRPRLSAQLHSDVRLFNYDRDETHDTSATTPRESTLEPRFAVTARGWPAAKSDIAASGVRWVCSEWWAGRSPSDLSEAHSWGVTWIRVLILEFASP